MNKTKIEWCDSTINPVVGCPRGCPYCYARRMNDRFKWVDDFSKPEFKKERLKALESKKGKAVFMNSVSDIAYWDARDIHWTLEAMEQNPQHKYIFLSKDWGDAYNNGFPSSMKGVYKGLTVTRQVDLGKHCFEDFLNIEPILEPISLYPMLTCTATDHVYAPFNAVIIGAETGNRKGKVIPKQEWIDDLVRQADELGLKVFMKDSLIPVVGEENMRRELIWEVHK